MTRREEIYEKALSLFIEAGYDDTPMSRIARELNLTKAGLYHYFGSKQELLFLIHDHFLKRDFIPIIEAAEEIADPQEQITHFLKNYAKLIAKDAAGRILIHEVKRLKPEHRRRITKVWKRAFNLIRDAIKEMERSGSAKKLNATYSAFAAIGMCSWILYWFDYSRSESAEELAESLVEIFFKGLST